MLWYHVALENSKGKVCISGSSLEERSIGSALIAFFDVDWCALHEKCAPQCAEHGEAHCDNMELQVFYQELNREVTPLHPLLQIFVEDQLAAAWVTIAMENKMQCPSYLPTHRLYGGRPVVGVGLYGIPRPCSVAV